MIGPDHGLVPAASRDAQFRRLTPHAGHWRMGDGTGAPWPLPSLFSVGEFDPGRLRGFDPRSAVPLETYAPPYLTPVDSAARRVLGGRSLAPNGNIGGYLAQQPRCSASASRARRRSSRRPCSGGARPRSRSRRNERHETNLRPPRH